MENINQDPDISMNGDEGDSSSIMSSTALPGVLAIAAGALVPEEIRPIQAPTQSTTVPEEVKDGINAEVSMEATDLHKGKDQQEKEAQDRVEEAPSYEESDDESSNEESDDEMDEGSNPPGFNVSQQQRKRQKMQVRELKEELKKGDPEALKRRILLMGAAMGKWEEEARASREKLEASSHHMQAVAKALQYSSGKLQEVEKEKEKMAETAERIFKRNIELESKKIFEEKSVGPDKPMRDDITWLAPPGAGENEEEGRWTVEGNEASTQVEMGSSSTLRYAEKAAGIKRPKIEESSTVERPWQGRKEKFVLFEDMEPNQKRTWRRKQTRIINEIDLDCLREIQRAEKTLNLNQEIFKENLNKNERKESVDSGFGEPALTRRQKKREERREAKETLSQLPPRGRVQEQQKRKREEYEKKEKERKEQLEEKKSKEKAEEKKKNDERTANLPSTSSGQRGPYFRPDLQPENRSRSDDEEIKENDIRNREKEPERRRRTEKDPEREDEQRRKNKGKGKGKKHSEESRDLREKLERNKNHEEKERENQRKKEERNEREEELFRKLAERKRDPETEIERQERMKKRERKMEFDRQAMRERKNGLQRYMNWQRDVKLPNNREFALNQKPRELNERNVQVSSRIPGKRFGPRHHPILTHEINISLKNDQEKSSKNDDSRDNRSRTSRNDTTKRNDRKEHESNEEAMDEDDSKSSIDEDERHPNRREKRRNRWDQKPKDR